ncbi:MAG: hypothetical protein ACYC3S_05860 [Chloroflexota bacterium]
MSKLNPMEHGTPNERPGPPKGEAYGMAAVTQAFQGTDFPASKADLIRKAGSHRISWTKGGDKLNLADLIRSASSDQFPGMANVVAAVAESARKHGKPEGSR